MAAPPRKRPHGGRARNAGPAIARVIEAAIAFRQGWAAAIRDKHATTLALAVETLDAASLADVKGGVLVLTHARARTLKIPLYTPDAVALRLGGASPEDLRAIADPTLDLSDPMKGPFTGVRETLPAGFAASVKLAKLAGLLPATVAKQVEKKPRGAIEISADDIRDFEKLSLETLAIIARARVPLEGAEDAELIAFRARDGGAEHYALIIGAPPHDAPALTRLHSECFTGDVLGSLRCDCGPQLRGAIEMIAEAGGGIVLYLAQEGRGIGPVNKLRAYRLQDRGFDTMEANERLGFEADERLYGVAAKMLSLLGYRSVRLLTNNPAKVEALKRAGIRIAERVPHRLGANVHNREYLKTKAAAGHLL